MNETYGAWDIRQRFYVSAMEEINKPNWTDRCFYRALCFWLQNRIDSWECNALLWSTSQNENIHISNELLSITNPKRTTECIQISFAWYKSMCVCVWILRTASANCSFGPIVMTFSENKQMSLNWKRCFNCLLKAKCHTLKFSINIWLTVRISCCSFQWDVRDVHRTLYTRYSSHTLRVWMRCFDALVSLDCVSVKLLNCFCA